MPMKASVRIYWKERLKDKRMTFNKEICKKCYVANNTKWSDWNDKNWERGTLECPTKVFYVKPPPLEEICPYILEHTLKNQNENK
jgi:hypothetical protein